MRKKVGCPKSVIKRQIEKYERALEDEKYLIYWIKNEFGDVKSCPVCFDWGTTCFTESYNCPAVVDGKSCPSQIWFNDLMRHKYSARTSPVDTKDIRRIVKTRLIHWKEVYNAR